MEPLIIKITEDSPAVIFYPKYEKFQIVGSSWLESPGEFYSQIISWLENYFNNRPLEETIIEFYFKFLNTPSFREIIKLFTLLKKLSEKHKIKIKWFYDPQDIDIKRFGERIEKYFGCKIQYGEKKIKAI